MDENTPKHPLTSKTLWVNALLLASWIGVRFAGIDEIPPEQIDAAAVSLATLSNIALRFVTSKPIQF